MPKHPKLVFMTAIQCLDEKKDIYRTLILTEAGEQSVFQGTREECERYNANLHHSINPNIVEKFNPRKDVRRRYQ